MTDGPEGEMVRQIGAWVGSDSMFNRLSFTAHYERFDNVAALSRATYGIYLFVSDTGWFYLIGRGMCERYASEEAAMLAREIVR